MSWNDPRTISRYTIWMSSSLNQWEWKFSRHLQSNQIWSERNEAGRVDRLFFTCSFPTDQNLASQIRPTMFSLSFFSSLIYDLENAVCVKDRSNHIIEPPVISGMGYNYPKEVPITLQIQLEVLILSLIWLETRKWKVSNWCLPRFDYIFCDTQLTMNSKKSGIFTSKPVQNVKPIGIIWKHLHFWWISCSGSDPDKLESKIPRSLSWRFNFVLHKSLTNPIIFRATIIVALVVDF